MHPILNRWLKFGIGLETVLIAIRQSLIHPWMFRWNVSHPTHPNVDGVIALVGIVLLLMGCREVVELTSAETHPESVPAKQPTL